MPDINLTQRQYLTLYRLAQFGFSTRENLMQACFFDMADPVQKYREHIVPITKGEGRATGNPNLVLKFKSTDFLYIGESGLSALHESLQQNRPYNLQMLPNPRNVKSNRNLDEYAGLAPVFAKFCQLEGGEAQVGSKRYTIERVEVYCKPDDLQFYAEGKSRQIKPDGLVVLYRRDKNGALQFDWLYL